MNSQLLSGKHVLVVEDEMLAAMQLEDMLGDLGCSDITIAGDVETALSSLAENAFDLATVDLNLHGTKAYPVAEALGERKIPFAFATGYGASFVDWKYKKRPVLVKPYTGSQFEKVMVGLLTNEMPSQTNT